LTGRTVEVENPVNRFPLSIAPAYLFIAGGIGITPLLPMCRSAASAGIPWTLHYGGRSRGSMAFLTDLDEFDHAHIAIHPEDEAGLLDLDSILTAAPPNAVIYCCGPSGLLKAVEQRCAAMTLSRQLHVERFSTDSATPSDRPTGGTFDVELRRSGIVLHVPTDRSVLDVVREAVPDVASSCEEGWCGTCETRVLDGQPEHRDDLLSEDERRSGQRMLICVSRSALPKLVLDL
jgi:ferredoxin-NADP reductase